MRHKILFCFLLLVGAATTMAQSVTVRFTARTTGGEYHQFDSVRVENVTQGWSQVIAYPDTTLVLGVSSGIAAVERGETVEMKVYPNPFAGRAESVLQLNEEDEVCVRVVRVNGAVVSEYNGRLAAGTYRLGVSLKEPQVAFLSVATKSGRCVAKMVNTAEGEEDRIDVVQESGMVQRMKAVGIGPFAIGDQMRYTAVSVSGGERMLSNTVDQSQIEDGLVTLVFEESGGVTLPTVTTSMVENITANTATCGGIVNNDGGATVTERGVCWNTSQNPTILDSHTSDGSGTGSFTSNISGLEAGTVYNIRAYAINERGCAYGDVLKFVTDTITSTPGCSWVDLGLPSGIQWYSCNIGASSPEEYGDYFAWGETQTKSIYDWSTYAYGSGWTLLTKYCNISEYGLNGFVDNLTTLEAVDDAATAEMGNGARIATYAEWQELIDNTSAEMTTVNGVFGRKFTASNGNSIFLPAAGEIVGTEFSVAGVIGEYWTSSLYTDGPGNAGSFFFSSEDSYVSCGGRYAGFPVRAVRSAH